MQNRVELERLGLFELNPYQREHVARVVRVEDMPEGAPGQYGVQLDNTIFFPGGGGQPEDEGFLGGAAVRGFCIEDGFIRHYVDQMFAPGDEVVLRLDWERRLDYMQQHTGQHILSQAVLKVLGYDTHSVHFGAVESTIDVLARDVSDEEAGMVEKESNRAVLADISIETLEITPAEARDMNMRKLSESAGPVRVVRIGDYDVASCCGIHLRSTGETGPIKIVRLERADGYLRMAFLCGHRALRDYRRCHKICREISYVLGQPLHMLVETVKSLETMRRKHDFS